MDRPRRSDEPTPDLVEFGLLVQEWRRALGLSQRRFADKVWLSQSAISRLERGRLPSLTLWRLLPILEVAGIVPRPRRSPSPPT